MRKNLDNLFTRMVSTPEIQKHWKEPKIGDRTNRGLIVRSIDTEKRFLVGLYRFLRMELIWHPGQRDLQDMSRHNKESDMGLHMRFNTWLWEACIYDHTIYGPQWIAFFSNDSLRQAWAAFYMDTYNKAWGGNEWVHVRVSQKEL